MGAIETAVTALTVQVLVATLGVAGVREKNLHKYLYASLAYMHACARELAACATAPQLNASCRTGMVRQCRTCMGGNDRAATAWTGHAYGVLTPTRRPSFTPDPAGIEGRECVDPTRLWTCARTSTMDIGAYAARRSTSERRYCKP